MRRRGFRRCSARWIGRCGAGWRAACRLALDLVADGEAQRVLLELERLRRRQAVVEGGGELLGVEALPDEDLPEVQHFPEVQTGKGRRCSRRRWW